MKNYILSIDQGTTSTRVIIFDKKFNSTIRGITLFDALVFRNWLAFAKMVGDDTYKLVTDQVFYSKFIEEKLKLKLKTN